MAVNTESVAAATAVVGYDLLTNAPQVRQSGANRVINSVALTGSAAAGDTKVSLRVSNVEIASVFNTSTGFPTQDASKIDLGGAFIPAGAPLSAIVTDAPATNPINIQTDIDELS